MYNDFHENVERHFRSQTDEFEWFLIAFIKVVKIKFLELMFH